MCNMLTLDRSTLSPVCICFCNFYDVVDGFVLRCAGSGIGSVSLFVSNMLTLAGSKLFPACICFFNFYDVVDGLLLRCSGSGIGSVWLIFSSAWSKKVFGLSQLSFRTSYRLAFISLQFLKKM